MGAPLPFFTETLLFLRVGGQENNEEDIVNWFWRNFSFPLWPSDTFVKCILYKMFSQWPSFCLASLLFFFLLLLLNIAKPTEPSL